MFYVEVIITFDFLKKKRKWKVYANDSLVVCFSMLKLLNFMVDLQ